TRPAPAYLPLRRATGHRSRGGGRGDRRGWPGRRAGAGGHGSAHRRIARHRQPQGALMTSNHLLRELAPLSDAAWSQVDTEARTRLTTQRAARKVGDFDGPDGWVDSAVSLGPGTSIAAPAAGPAQVRQRQVLAIVEVRVPFSVGRDAIEDAGRGADDIDLSELDDASRKFGVIENTTVFHGYEAAGIT